MENQDYKGTILVVEDNPAMNNAICDILELNDYTVHSASNGMAALELLKSERPDVVLCDIMMPKMDGYTLLRHTRSEERLRTLPFIFLTARSSAEDKRRAKSIGIEDYLVKPVDPEDLILAVENALRRMNDLAVETQSQMDMLRNQIVRTLQHEFRTPLTFILGYAEYMEELVEDRVDLDTLRVSTNAILEGGHRLQDLIEKFLMLADVQFRQQLPGQMEKLMAYQILQNVAKSMISQAKDASLQIVLRDTNTDAHVVGDLKYLHKAVEHLVENAIQYKRPESRYIWLGVRQSDSHVGLAVDDESKGIPKELLNNLQRPFEQLERDDRTTPGAGLSLALIQHIARLHGGYLQIESELGTGSIFTLWLPKPPNDETQNNVDQDPSPPNRKIG